MKRETIRVLAAGAAMLACGVGTASAGKGGGGEDKAVAELKAATVKMMDAWASGNAKDFGGGLSASLWNAWDTDMVGRPAGWTNTESLMKFYSEAMGMMKSMGASMKFTPRSIDCHASGDLGVCLVEADTTMTMPKMPPMSMPVRSTEVYRKEKGVWKAVHHHGSIAKDFDMPAKFMALSGKSGNFMDAPGMPGMKMAPIWMNPMTQQGAAVFKAGAEGMKQPRHFHSFGATIAVLEGAIVTSDVNGKDAEFGPGSVVYRAAKELHTTTIKPNSVFLVVTDGPFDSIYVDASGKPLPPQHK
jgi:hypothetical protein